MVPSHSRFFPVRVPPPTLDSDNQPDEYRQAVAWIMTILTDPGRNLVHDFTMTGSSLVWRFFRARRIWQRFWYRSMTVRLESKEPVAFIEGDSVVPRDLTIYLTTPLPLWLQLPAIPQTAIIVDNGRQIVNLTDHLLPQVFGQDGVLPWDDEVRIMWLRSFVEWRLVRQRLRLEAGAIDADG